MSTVPPPPAPDAPRDEHRAYAARYGFFWLPCPICGYMFGGHEARRGGRLWLSPWSGNMTCPNCPGEHAVAHTCGPRCLFPTCTPRTGEIIANDSLADANTRVRDKGAN